MISDTSFLYVVIDFVAKLQFIREYAFDKSKVHSLDLLLVVLADYVNEELEDFDFFVLRELAVIPEDLEALLGELVPPLGKVAVGFVKGLEKSEKLV